MNKHNKHRCLVLWLLTLMISSLSLNARADLITDWNIIARTIVVDSTLFTPQANRVLAIVHTAVYEAANSITQEYSTGTYGLNTLPEASVSAAVAAANHTSLTALLPSQKAAIEETYLSALEAIPSGAERAAGILAGQAAAQHVLANRVNDGSSSISSYRPYTVAGTYVPTLVPAVPHWPNRKPWWLNSAAQFRPGPPPALGTSQWAEDFNEVKELGSIDSETRNTQQTAIAQFWEATLPPIYHGVVHSVANQSGRSVTQNARLFAMVTQGSDDALIAVFDAKYHYAFWRPITAIRNADLDGNDATVRAANWQPFISTPMHPEYPCAHCVVAGTVGSILKAEVGDRRMPTFSTSSTTANNAIRSWSSIDDFVQEVSEARIYDGVHYRTSTVVGNSMGQKIGALTVRRHSEQGR